MSIELSSKARLYLGRKLREIREQRKMTQEEVAKACDISTNYYAGIERGEENPTLGVLEILCKILKTKTADILPF